MRSARILFSIIAGFLASLLIAEFSLRKLPVSMGLYRTLKHDNWPLHAYGPNQNFSYSMTWQMLHPNRGKTNNYGHVAPFNYIPNSHPVVVIGDSFVEALMNRFEDTLQGELGRLLSPNTNVYGLGYSGNSLAEYLSLARMSKSEFAPVAMVFLIIDNDIKESWSNRTGHRYFQVNKTSIQEAYIPLDNEGFAQKIRYLVGDSALYRYVQVNLGFSLEGVISRRSPTKPELIQSVLPEIEEKSRRSVEYYLTTLPVASGIHPERLVLVFDSDRERIYDSSNTPRSGADSVEVQKYFKARATELGFKIIDTASLFSKHYQLHHRKFDYTPTDRHWNGLAHRIVASEVYKILALEVGPPYEESMIKEMKAADSK